MATITTSEGQPVTDQETRIRVLMALGMSRVDAEFVVELEDGEVDGDVTEGEEDDS